MEYNESNIENDAIHLVEDVEGISMQQKNRLVEVVAKYLNNREKQEKNFEKKIFDKFKDPKTDSITFGKFLMALELAGIRQTDPRLQEMMDNLNEMSKQAKDGAYDIQSLDFLQFKSIISPCVALIKKAIMQQLVIPDFPDFLDDIEEIYYKCKTNTEGENANYISLLSKVNPKNWGVSICTIDGQRFSIGDSDVPFTIQSVSKPLTYALALEHLGHKVVHSYIGREPSGRNFNELILADNKKPHNPMINSGAILTASLLQALVKPEMTLAEKFDYTQQWFRKLAGGESIGFNNAVFLSEREAADRNFALGFYMREYNCYPEKAILNDVMDFYFQCCCMETTCDSMSVIAATFANGGVCPITEEKVLKPSVIRDVLSIMHSCGTYDYSGQFAFDVGLPAKSGVSGGMLLVIPNLMGIFAWSPPLDQYGNSCRGVQFCKELVDVFNFHVYDNLKNTDLNKKDPRKNFYGNPNEISAIDLLFAAAKGDVSKLKQRRKSGADVNLVDYDGRTALHLAASGGHFECIKFLLEVCDVPYNPKDRWGRTPIDEAVEFGHKNIAQFLTNWKETKSNSISEDLANSDTLIELQEVPQTENIEDDKTLNKDEEVDSNVQKNSKERVRKTVSFE